ncbi:hypothetical protein [Sphingopyxis sp. PET50]|uniref:hypothetical protein n=1 Tax=Sphingopyxis sp. PET50 TaxID=2976533 RepID=UPI0021AFCF35|nr:hypothetical protein [Sphingopyxis sp. PET50]
MLDLDDIADVVSSAVKAATAPLIARNAELEAGNAALEKRLAALEARELPSVAGLASVDTVRELPNLEGYVTDESVKTLVTDAVSAAIAEIPAPLDGKSVEPEQVQAMVDKAVAALPEPKRGEKGLGIKDLLIDREGQLVATFEDGSTKALGRVVGKDAEPLPVDPEQLAGVVRAEVEKAVAALPAPEPIMVEPREVDMDALREIVDELAQQSVSEQLPDAIKGIPVPEAPAPIEPDMEAIGKMIADGVAKAVGELPEPKKGDDGVGVAGALIDKEGHLVLTTSDGRTHDLGLVVGKDGKPGETFTLDDFDIEQTDERTLEFKFLNGNMMHSFELEFPVPIFREAYKEGREYRKGDMVVWGGSLWAATKDTGAKPDTPDSGWMIAARRGRDAKPPK